MVVVTGPVGAENAVMLGSELRKLQRECSVVVELWDVTAIDEVGVFALTAAKRRADAAGWGFAVVADPAGPVTEAIETAGATETLKPFTSRKTARRALQLASP
jgi:anti-anti-sigma regulatory factor